MANSIFQNLPEEYKQKKDEITNSILKKAYSKFTFKYLNFINDQNNNQNIDQNAENIEESLSNYLKNFKFITYYIENLIPHQESVNAVFCFEGECIIIENIKESIISNILNNQNSSLINSNKQINQNDKKQENDTNKQQKNDTNKQQEINEEITTLINESEVNIQKESLFIKLTIKPIFAYLIRRFFYPSHYFKNQSFFRFREHDNSSEIAIKQSLQEFLFSKTEDLKKNFKKCINCLMSNDAENNEIITQDFKKKDFIYLRKIHTNETISFELGIHRESLHIFAIKDIENCQKDKLIHIDREIDFCKNHHHHCFIPFYGFMKKNRKKVGFVYKFMVNNTLDKIIKSSRDEINELYSLMIINRICQGIRYLHSNSLIYRDLKPSNILIDQDFIPYIADLETIKNEQEKSLNITGDFATPKYAAPEQQASTGGNFMYSNPVDIFPIGLIIYFIYEKKDFQWEIEQNSIKLTYDSKVPDKIVEISQSCVNFDQKKRPNIYDVINVIAKEILQLSYFENYLMNEKIDKPLIIQYLYEIVSIAPEKLKDNVTFFYFFGLFCSLRTNCEYSSFLLEIGKHYEYINEDYIKAKEYYEKSQTADAFVCLGHLYFNGKGVKQSYEKAEKCYIKSGKKDPYVLNFLGNIYSESKYENHDYEKAIKCYKQSGQLGNSDSYHNIGIMYYKGDGVVQNFKEALKYYKKAAKMGNASALNDIGNFYHDIKNYKKAKKYYEKAADLNDSDGLYNLGYLYFKGLGVIRNYEKAEEYYKKSADLKNDKALNNLGELYYYYKFDLINAVDNLELASKQNNSFAMYKLGKLYEKGIGFPKEFTKALEHYKKSAELGNSFANVKLGKIYQKLNDYIKAKEYYEKAEKSNNSEAFYRLGKLEKDHKKAEEYFKKSARLGNNKAWYLLGEMYKENIPESLKYFKISAHLKNTKAMIYLAHYYSITNNESEAMKYYMQCASKIYIYTETPNSQENYTDIKRSLNQYYLRAKNDLGLIYLFKFEDMDKATKYIKDSALDGYPFGRSNYGLLCQFYLSDLVKAESFYKDTKFSLAYYNLGYLKEKKGEIDESITNYIKASELENDPLMFRQAQHDDKYLENSKTFIICFTNLKLCEYYFNLNEYEKSKKYFIKAFQNINTNTYKFHFNFSNVNNAFSYLKSFIFNSPLFNLGKECKISTNNFVSNGHSKVNSVFQNDKEIKLTENIYKQKQKINTDEIKSLFYEKQCKNNKSNEKQSKSENLLNDLISANKNDEKMSKYNEIVNKMASYDDLEELFNFILDYFGLKYMFIREINEIIRSMKRILYTPPYPILFGRINYANKKENPNQHRYDINDEFYEGFGM